MHDHQMLVFTGNANHALAQTVCDYLELPLGKASVSRFPDGELNVKVLEDVRGTDAFIVQPTCYPVNDHLMELLMLIDCLRRASATRVTAVLPYFGYARKDRKDEGRVPITAKLVANLITTAGADRVLAVDLHASQIQGFFDLPVDHLYASSTLARSFRESKPEDLVIVSPDVGSIKLARAHAERLSAGLAVVDKRRVSPEETEVSFVIGDVRGKNVLIVDDIIATAGSVCEASQLLRERGAESVQVAATHGVFCGPAFERLKQAPIDQVTVTDSIPLPSQRDTVPIRVVSVAPLIGEAMKRIHLNQSVSSLFAEA
ncbi:MAG: ribose-phosphate diphosphokinase [Candidatus Brocadiia bacterium]